MDTLIGWGLLCFCLLCCVCLWWDQHLTLRDIQRWERRESRRGGTSNRNASTGTNLQTGMPWWTGWGTPAETTEVFKLIREHGQIMPLKGSPPTLPRLVLTNNAPLPTESGRLTGEDGEDSGQIPPGNAA